jgi:sterol desaturase/sphingolipid hydroxylase (fatty acid hydroxylase superfamily)
MDSSFLVAHEMALRLSAFAVVLAAMATWEVLAPRRTLSVPRLQRWRANFGVAVFNILLLRVALPTTAIGMAEFAAGRGWGLFNQLGVGGWAAVALCVVALDFVLYLQHVALHHVPVLVRLHAVHHADPEFDATTGIRFHPLEILLSMLVKYAAIVALGAPALAVLFFELLLSLSSLFSHGNVRLPEAADRLLRRGLVTPDMHRIHHSVIEAERNSNYGFCLSAWDHLLGTYTSAPQGGQRAMRIGLEAYPDPRVSTTLSGILTIPFRSLQRSNT